MKTESCSVMSDSLRPCELYSPWNSLGQYTGVGSLPFSRDLPNPGIKPRSSTLQVDSLQAEPQGKPKNTRVNSLSPYSRRSSQARNWTRVPCIAGGFSTNWATRDDKARPRLEGNICKLCKDLYLEHTKNSQTQQ